MNSTVSSMTTQTTLDETTIPRGCGCTHCQSGYGHVTGGSDSLFLRDLAVLPGGGGTVTPAAIGVNNAAQLIHGNEWRPGGGTAVSLTYSFLTSVPSYYSPAAQERVNFTPFTPTMEAGVRAALNSVSTFANVTFTEVTGVGDLTFGQAWLTTALSDPLAWAYYPDQGGHSGDIWFNNKYSFDSVMDSGELGYYVAAHEIGHALGLIHSFTAGLTGAENTEKFTVMAYDTSPWGSRYAGSYMLYDISAIQAIYGANTGFNSGDTTYVLDPSAAYTVWDGGGVDTFDSSAVISNVVIYLEEGAFSSVGLVENIAIAYGTVIENATTGTGNDFLYGNAVDNILNGGAGSDTLEGKAGNDTYVYHSGGDNIVETTGLDRVEFFAAWSPSDVTIVDNVLTFAAGLHEIVFNDINLIEFFSFDGFADLTLSELVNFGVSPDDVFIGTPVVEAFDGGAGNDTVDYSGSLLAVKVDLQNTTTSGTSGGYAEGDLLISIENVIGSNQTAERDWIWGDAFVNVLSGMAGNDILEGGGGADVINGGTGWDVSRYLRSAEAVQINLETGVNTGGDAQGDILIDIEAIVGSAYDDVIVGAASSNFYKGEGGNDTITGGSGADQIFGGDGNDILHSGGGIDILYGNDGADMFVFEGSEVLSGNANIQDFSTVEGDILDVSDLLVGYDPLTALIEDFIQITDDGTTSYLAVDTDGGANNFVQLAILHNIIGLTDEAALETAGSLITV